MRKKYKKEHKDRKKNGKDDLTKDPKYKINKAMNRWWKGDYGKQNYFSLKDAITQKRCNGDEMLWYLFYSKPSKMDEFCTNTNFGNKIPKDFCKLNPPVYFNFTVTPKNIREPQNRGKTFSWRPDWHKEKFGDDFIFTGFASENNPDVWDTKSERDSKFNDWFTQWCTESDNPGTNDQVMRNTHCTGTIATRSQRSSSFNNIHSLSFLLLFILPSL